jgi:DNA-binding MarR family transcriptional regulator
MTADLKSVLRLGFLVHDVSRLRRSVVDRALRPLGVTRSQWWVLAYLSREDGMPQVVLADQLDVGKVALGGLIDRLEASGLVERRLDQTDRRVKRVFLTRKGTELVEQIRDHVSEAEAAIVAGINARDLERFGSLLKKMKGNLLELLKNGESEPDEGLD